MATLIPKFKQAGAGASNRAINLKLAETVSVADYGAIGDGSNQTTAIQAAIAATTSGTLYFPPGTYVVDNNVIEPLSNTSWYLPVGATLKNVTTSAVYNTIIIDGVHDFALFGGGTIEGYVVNNAAANAISINISNSSAVVDTYNITIDNITFTNSNGECIYIGSGGGASVGVRNVIVNNCKISGARRNGIAVSAANFVTITNNEISATFNPDHIEICSGIDIEPLTGMLATNIYIGENYIHGNYGCGITLYGGAGGSAGAECITNVSIENNYFDDNCKAGLSVSSTLVASLETTTTAKVSIINNKLTGLNKRGGISVDLNREGAVIGNSLTGESATAIHPTNSSFLSGITIAACNGVIVSDNSVKASNYNGFYLYQSSNCIITNNVADNILIFGLFSQSNTDCEFTGNLMNNIQQAGIYSLNDNYGNFLNNRIIDNNKAGLVTTAQAGAAIVITYSSTNSPTNMKVMGNTVRTPTTIPTYPLRIQGANVTNCVACPNDFRGTFVNAVTNTGTGTILSQTDVVNLT
jgi:parallel beta-helix repeat protein